MEGGERKGAAKRFAEIVGHSLLDPLTFIADETFESFEYRV